MKKHLCYYSTVLALVGGSVLDGFSYTVVTSQANYTFRADMTYYVQSPVTLTGVTTFEGGAVIKYAIGASINLSDVQCKATAYHPVILTAKDDNSVGDTINGSNGNPGSTRYANPALNFTSDYYGITWSVSNFRIAYASQAISASCVSFYLYLSNGQFVNCQNGIHIPGQGGIFLRNLLFANVLSAFNDAAYANFNIQNTTFAGSPNYPTTPAFLATPNGGPLTLYLKNCILANLTMFVSGPPVNWTLNGDYNGFYNNGDSPFGSVQVTPTGPPFQIKGAGNYYLTDTGFRNVGATDIDPVLASDLKKKTTFPPANPPTPGPSVTWDVLVQRDTDTPDLGYHYDPLDYLCSGYYISVPNNLLNGVCVGLYGSSGFIIQNSAGLYFKGRPDAISHLVWYPSVQEQPVRLNNIATPGSPLFNTSSAPLTPKLISLSFTDVSMQGRRQPVFDVGYPYYWPVLIVKDSFLRGVNLTVSAFYYNAYPGSSVSLQNNVLERSTVYLYNGYAINYTDVVQNPLDVSLYNNLLWNSTLTLTYKESQDAYKPTWYIKDNLFDSDSVSLTGDGQYLQKVSRSNNAFYNTTPGQLSGTGDVTLTSLTYTTGPLGSWYIASSEPSLVDAGSRSSPAAGLYHHTISADLTKELCSQVDIGFHHAWTDSLGTPPDANGNGIPDCLDDSNGNGTVNSGEVPWAPAVTVEAITPTAYETGQVPGAFRITRTSEKLNVSLIVQIQLAGSALNGVDYASLPAHVVIPANQTYVDVPVFPLQDCIAEPNETVQLTLLGCAFDYMLGAQTSATVTIVDATGIPTITVQATDPTASEANDPGTFTLSMSSGSGPLRVFFQLSGTATEGMDFDPIGTYVDFAPGATTANVTVNPIPDCTMESSETVTLTLAGCGNAYVVGAPNQATVTITDAQPPYPIVTVAAIDPNASEIGNDPGTFRITRNNTVGPLTVHFQLTGTATEGADYLPLGTGCVIPDGAPSIDLLVVPLSDFVYPEPTESAILTLSPCPGSYTVGTPGSAQVNITDGPPPPLPVITIQPIDKVACEDTHHPGIFAVLRNNWVLAAPITINFVTGGTATEGVDYTSLLPHQITIPANSDFATALVMPIADAVPEGTETAVITLQAGPNYQLGTPTAATIDIRDSCSDCNPLPGAFWVDSSPTDRQLAEWINDPTDTVTNVTYTGAHRARGVFGGGTSAGLPIERGVILTSGDVALAPGPNNSSGAGFANGQPGDADLDRLVPGLGSQDAAALEFDLTSQSGEIEYEFIFASEEYLEYVGQFNDIMGIFVNSSNIAWAPGTTTVPVGVNTIYTGQNAEFFTWNEQPPVFDVQYDGLTTTALYPNLTARISVPPGSTRHIKIVIADAGDQILDSAVLFRAKRATPCQ